MLSVRLGRSGTHCSSCVRCLFLVVVCLLLVVCISNSKHWVQIVGAKHFVLRVDAKHSVLRVGAKRWC